MAFKLALVLGLSAGGTAGWAQGKAGSGQSLSGDLFRLQLCLKGDANLERLRSGLMGGYSQASQGYEGLGGYGRRVQVPQIPFEDTPPAEYMASLDRDVSACDYAARIKDAEERRGVLEAVQKDVEIKSHDCQQFGMGRMVPVRIMTLHGALPANGWAAFYKWSSVSGFPVSELRVPGLTSPAVLNLPPGVYAFRAELTAGDVVRKTNVITLAVGGQRMVDVQLPVP